MPLLPLDSTIVIVLYGLHQMCKYSKPRRVQNASARLIMDIPKFPHVTPGLYELHTLPIAYWIKFKILIVPFKSIHGLGPSYF